MKRVNNEVTKRYYSCKVCPLYDKVQFNTRSLLQQHVQAVHSDHVYHCYANQCKFSSVNPELFQKHLKKKDHYMDCELGFLESQENKDPSTPLLFKRCDICGNCFDSNMTEEMHLLGGCGRCAYKSQEDFVHVLWKEYYEGKPYESDRTIFRHDPNQITDCIGLKSKQLNVVVKPNVIGATIMGNVVNDQYELDYLRRKPFKELHILIPSFLETTQSSFIQYVQEPKLEEISIMEEDIKQEIDDNEMVVMSGLVTPKVEPIDSFTDIINDPLSINNLSQPALEQEKQLKRVPHVDMNEIQKPISISITYRKVPVAFKPNGQSRKLVKCIPQNKKNNLPKKVVAKKVIKHQIIKPCSVHIKRLTQSTIQKFTSQSSRNLATVLKGKKMLSVHDLKHLEGFDIKTIIDFMNNKQSC